MLITALKNSYKKIAFVPLIILCMACGKDKCDKTPDISKVNVEITIKRLEKEMFEAKNKEDLIKFLDSNPVFTNEVLDRYAYPHDSVLVNEIFELGQNIYMDSLYQEVLIKFGDLDNLKEEFKNAFRLVKYYFPEFAPPQIHTMVTGFSNDLLLTDSILFIGLDFFLGDKSRYRPNVANYILKRYNPEYIVPNSLLHISSRYNKLSEQDNTLIAEMIYQGKAYYFTEKMLPCTPDSILIGYSDEHINSAYNNMEYFWSYFIEKQLLFKTDHFMKSKYIGERPYTAEIGTKVPGRLGVWFGWEIVDSYMKNNSKADLRSLMQNDNAQEIFSNSKFKPKDR